MQRVFVILLLLFAVGCYNRADSPVIDGELPAPTLSISQLHKAIPQGEARKIEDEMIIVGRVTSSDMESNFYGSFMVEDDGAAVEVLADISQLHARYPEGVNVALKLQGCYAAYQRGVLQLGAAPYPDNHKRIVGFGSLEALDKVVIRSIDVTPQQPVIQTIGELQREDCGCLIRIDKLHLVASATIDTTAGELLSDARWRGYSLYKDARGDSIAVYTRSYAQYAERYIPHGELSITGILQYGEYNSTRECYQIKMSHEMDCINM